MTSKGWSHLLLVVCILSLVLAVVWPTRDWMTGPLMVSFFYVPLILIQFFLWIIANRSERWTRLAVILQSGIATWMLINAIRYVLTHPR